MAVTASKHKTETQLLTFYPVTISRLIVILLFTLLQACHSVPVALATNDSARLDELLVLINERLSIAPKVAQVKWNSGAPIDDWVREAKVLAEVSRQSAASGANEAFARHFFQAQIDANKLFQRRLHEQWRSQKQPPFAQPPDLAREVRPIIDALTPRLIAALKAIQPIVHKPEAQHYLLLASKQKIRGDFNGEVREMAVSALVADAGD